MVQIQHVSVLSYKSSVALEEVNVFCRDDLQFPRKYYITGEPNHLEKAQLDPALESLFPQAEVAVEQIQKPAKAEQSH